MRRVGTTATLILTACSTMPPPEPVPPVRGETPGYTCSEVGLDSFVGQGATAEVGAEILRQSGARILRWIPKGGVVTMDLRIDRVNVKLDSQNRIEAVICG